MKTNYAKKGTMTNAQFAQQDHHFHQCCEKAGVPATVRQAAKFRNGRGQAFTQHLIIAGKVKP